MIDKNIAEQYWEYKRDKIDKVLTRDFKCIIQENLKEAYEKEFGEAVKNYNEKQKRKDRKIKNYLDKIKKSENGEQNDR